MISTTEATKDLTSAIKGFKLSTEAASLVVDKLTKIDQVAAISAGNLAEGLARVSTTAQQAGLSLDETAAMVTTITEVTQRDASTAGEALRTLISRYSNVKAGVFTSMGEEAEETSENINDIEKVLGKLGIRIRTSGTEMRSIEDVLDELAEKWDTLDDVSRNAVASAFAGVRQRESFNILLSNWDRVKELTEESANAAGTANEKYSAYMDSMEAATKRLQNAWEGFTQSLETSTVMKGLTKATAFLVENADKLKYLVTVIAAASSARIFDFFTNKGETGGWKGLIASIPFIGRGTKTNNILESIDKKVGDIRGEVKKDKSKTTKNGGLISRLMSRRKQYKADKAFVKKDAMQAAAMAASKEAYLSQAKKVNVLRVMSEDIGGPLSDFDEMQEAQIMRQQYEEEKKILQEKRQQYKAQKAISKTNKKEVKLAKARIAAQKALSSDTFKQTAAVSGIATLATQLMTTKQVSGYGQTVEETGGDKALRTGLATAGSVAGALIALTGPIGGAIAPIASSLGSIAGEGLAGLISKWIHEDELQMKQRVADAKENLKALNSIKSTIEESTKVLTKESLDSEDFNKLQEFTQKLREQFVDYDADQKAQFIDYFKSSEGLTKEEETALEQFGEINTIEDIVKKIENGNVEQRKLIKQQLEIAAARQTAENLVNSQAEERAKYGETLEKARKASGKLKNEEIRKYYQGIIADDSKGSSEIEQADKDLNSFNEAVAGIRQLNKEVAAAKANIGFLAADIFDLSNNEISDLTMDGIVGLVVKALEGFNIEVRDSAGYIKEDYLSAIKTLIKTDSRFNTLLKGDTKTLNQLYNSQEKFEELVKGEVKDKDNKVINDKTWENLYALAQQGKLSEEIAKIVYAANPDRIEQFAAAWNTTRENLNNLVADYPNLTTAIGLMSPSEVREYYSVFTDFFSDLVDDSTLTAENFEKLLKSYPQLLKYYKAGSDTLSTELIKAMGDEQTKAYMNALTNEIFKGAGTMDALKSDFVNVMKGVPGVAEDLGFSPEDIEFVEEYYNKYIDGETTIEGLLTKAYSLKKSINNKDQEAGKNIENLVNKYLQGMREIQIENPLYKAAKQAEIDHISDIIDNLTEQKDMLSKVNDERKKEIELIRAKNALENAKKEKKRVYRRGKVMPLSNYIG